MKSFSFRNSPVGPGCALLLLLSLVAGCDRSQTTAAPVAATPAAAPAPAAVAASAPTENEVYVEAAPPPPQNEVMIASPGPGFTWIAGYWGWQGGRHEWVRGRWERPPEHHHDWVPARWERRGRGYVYIRGYWR